MRMVYIFRKFAVGWRYGENLDRKDRLALLSSHQGSFTWRA